MKLKEIKCENCGSIINITENTEKVTCTYCRTTFAVENAYKDGYDFEKGRQRAQEEQREKDFENFNKRVEEITSQNGLFKITQIFLKIIFIIAFLCFIFAFFWLFNDLSDFNGESVSFNDDTKNIVSDFSNRREEIESAFNDVAGNVFNNIDDNIDINFDFNHNKINNSFFEMYTGKQMGASVIYALNEVINNNSTNSNNLISVIFSEKNYIEPADIIELENKIDKFKDYTILYEYDESGQINKMIIK